MRANPLKQRLQAGEIVYTGWLHIPSGWSAEIMAHQGWDALTVDMQHGLSGYADARVMLQAIAGTPTVPLVRPTALDGGEIGRLLDLGALGIICPMVNTPDDAARLVAACRYAPEGTRSLGPTRAALLYGADYAAHTAELLILPMIETTDGLTNLDAIVAVDGVDGVFIGPGDLNQSLYGAGKLDSRDPAFLQILGDILQRVRATGKFAGIYTASPDYAAEMRALGFHLIAVSSDGRMLAAGSQAILQYLKQADRTPDTPAPSTSGTQAVY